MVGIEIQNPVGVALLAKNRRQEGARVHAFDRRIQERQTVQRTELSAHFKAVDNKHALFLTYRFRTWKFDRSVALNIVSFFVI